MLFQPPILVNEELEVIERTASIREMLKYSLSISGRWFGVLRRATFARNIRHSNSIEAINVTKDDALAAVDHDEPATAERADWNATVGYRNAMTYVLQLAIDPHFSYGEGLIRSLHFMMLHDDLSKNPGRYRPGPIIVYDEKKGEKVYDAPDSAEVPTLMHELMESLNEKSELPVSIRAALGHLNLVMIHPFSDGNGRMARCLQTLILAREQIVEPVFCSVEEYLGRYTQEYYDVLTQVGRGSFQPENDCRPWVRFILVAHYRQASWLLQRTRITQRVWDEIEHVLRRTGLNDRSLPALADAAFGYRVRRSHYLNSTDVSEQVASRDLKQLVDAGFLMPLGEKRGRVYIASDTLRQIYLKHYERRTNIDPFEQKNLPFPVSPAQSPLPF